MQKGFLEIHNSILGSIREPLMVLDSDLKVVTANHSFYRTFNVKPDETEGVLIYDLGNRQWDIPRLRRIAGRHPSSEYHLFMILRWNITLKPSAERSCI
jgi:PAS domain-containing protein